MKNHDPQNTRRNGNGLIQTSQTRLGHDTGRESTDTGPSLAMNFNVNWRTNEFVNEWKFNKQKIHSKNIVERREPLQSLFND